MRRMAPWLIVGLFTVLAGGCGTAAPERAPSQAPQQPRTLAERVARMADEDLAGQVLMPYAYGQDATSIAQVVNFLKAQGLTVTKVYANNLLISAQGTNAQLAAVFGSPIHAYQTQGRTYEAPAGATLGHSGTSPAIAPMRQ